MLSVAQDYLNQAAERYSGNIQLTTRRVIPRIVSLERNWNDFQNTLLHFPTGVDRAFVLKDSECAVNPRHSRPPLFYCSTIAVLTQRPSDPACRQSSVRSVPSGDLCRVRLLAVINHRNRKHCSLPMGR